MIFIGQLGILILQPPYFLPANLYQLTSIKPFKNIYNINR